MAEIRRDHVGDAPALVPDRAAKPCQVGAAFLERGRVALSSGPTFGAEGKGFARLNLATTRALLEEAVRRIAIGRASRSL